MLEAVPLVLILSPKIFLVDVVLSSNWRRSLVERYFRLATYRVDVSVLADMRYNTRAIKESVHLAYKWSKSHV